MIQKPIMKNMSATCLCMAIVAVGVNFLISSFRSTSPIETGLVSVPHGQVSVFQVEQDIFFTTGYEGSVIYVWNLRDKSKPTVRVYRCRPIFEGDQRGSQQLIELHHKVDPK